MRVSLCVCALVISLLPSHAQPRKDAAPGFEPIKDFAPSLITHEVPGGRVEAWSRYVPCNANIEATILQSHTDPDWNSQLRISLSNNPTVSKKFENFDPARIDEAIAITLVSDLNGIAQTKSWAVIERQDDNKLIAYHRLPNRIKNGTTYLVKVRWEPSGRVIASIDNGSEHAMKMDKPVTTFSLYFSGVKAQVRDLQIGRIGPKATEKDTCGIS